MLNFSAKIFALAAFAAVVAFVGFVFWRTLFPPHHPVENAASSNEQYSDQQRAEKHAPVGNAIGDSANEKIANYTLALAVFTAMLVLVAAFQIAFLIRADETATRTAQAAANSAQAALKQTELMETEKRPWVYADISLWKPSDPGCDRRCRKHLYHAPACRCAHAGYHPATHTRQFMML